MRQTRFVRRARKLAFRSCARLQTKFRADILCFRAFGLSQYQIEIVVERALERRWCRASLLATLPPERRYDPRIAQLYAGGAQTPNSTSLDFSEWSPLVFVELYALDGVWLRIEPPPAASRLLEVRFALYRQADAGGESALQFLREDVIEPTRSSGVKLQNLDAGAYAVFAYVQRANCRLVCEPSDGAAPTAAAAAAAATSAGCSPCAHTTLNFTLADAKLTVGWKMQRALVGAGYVMAIAILVLVGILAVALLAAIAYQHVWRPRRADRQPPQHFELVATPRVLLVYTDDCAEHSECW